MPWWTEEITSKIAVNFLKECQSYTQEVIRKKVPFLKDARYSHVIPSTIQPFTPLGAIIHSTRTPTIWDALQSLATQAYGTHFILGMNQQQLHKYEYLNDFPCMILMPMGWESATPHSNFMSTMTWGIDIRNIGLLRTYHNPFGTKPTPIFSGEEQRSDFRWEKQTLPKFYWSDDLWRREFDGKVQNWGHYYYERPTFAQVKGLVILLRVLNAINPMRREFILPSNCIHNIDMTLPHINWHTIRSLAIINKDEDIEPEDFDIEFNNAGYDDTQNPKSKDDIYINDITKYHLWRSESDDGTLNFIMNGEDARLSTASELKLIELGYDTTNINIAARFLTVAKQFRHEQVIDLEPLIEKIYNHYKGF